MDAQDVLTIGATAALLVQFAKWALAKRDPEGSHGPLLSIVVSALGVAVWALSRPVLPVRTDAWALFAGWAAVLATSAGVYGFVRTLGATVDGLRARRARPPA